MFFNSEFSVYRKIKVPIGIMIFRYSEIGEEQSSIIAIKMQTKTVADLRDRARHDSGTMIASSHYLFSDRRRSKRETVDLNSVSCREE